MNSLNDGTYYVNINFNVCFYNNNLFHILNVHMLFTLSPGNEYRSLHLFRLLRLSPNGARLSLSPPHYKAAAATIKIVPNNSFRFFINLIQKYDWNILCF